MGRVVIVGPPPGPWCVACLMRVKQKQYEMFEDQIKAGWDKSGEKTTVIAWPAVLEKELAEAAYRAVHWEFPQLGVIDLCWDDVAGINPSTAPSGLRPANGPLPPGLLKGR